MRPYLNNVGTGSCNVGWVRCLLWDVVTIGNGR